MASIIDLSHSINSESSGKAEQQTNDSKKRGRPPKQQQGPDEEALKKARAKAEKEAEKQKEKEEAQNAETRRLRKIQIINNYVDSPLFCELIEKLGIKQLKGTENEDVCDTILARIQDGKNMAYKRIWVNKMFELGTTTIGQLGQTLFKMEHFRNFTPAVRENHALFEEELEEIAIELDSSWVPSAKVRLVMKLATFVHEFHTTAGKQVPKSDGSKSLNQSADTIDLTASDDESK